MLENNCYNESTERFYESVVNEGSVVKKIKDVLDYFYRYRYRSLLDGIFNSSGDELVENLKLFIKASAFFFIIILVHLCNFNFAL